MPNAITRNLYLCLSRMKSTSSSSSAAPDRTGDPFFAPDSSSSSSSAPCSSSAIPFKNFNSLYDSTAATSPGSAASSKSATLLTATATTGTADSDVSTTITSSYAPYDRDLFPAISSRRLLPPSPSLSSAIADSAAVPVGIGVAVPTYSTDPYEEFLRSMQEMAAATGLLDSAAGAHSCGCRRCERLYELLLCYLVLNRKQAHKYIVGAFADLLLALPESLAAEAPEIGEEEERSGP